MDEKNTEAYVEVARLHKLRKLVAALDVLTDYDWDTAAALARRMSDVQWEGLALRAEVNAPSTVTRQMVIRSLDERLRIRRKIQSSPSGYYGPLKEYAR